VSSARLESVFERTGSASEVAHSPSSFAECSVFCTLCWPSWSVQASRCRAEREGRARCLSPSLGAIRSSSLAPLSPPSRARPARPGHCRSSSRHERQRHAAPAVDPARHDGRRPASSSCGTDVDGGTSSTSTRPARRTSTAAGSVKGQARCAPRDDRLAPRPLLAAPPLLGRLAPAVQPAASYGAGPPERHAPPASAPASAAASPRPDLAHDSPLERPPVAPPGHARLARPAAARPGRRLDPRADQRRRTHEPGEPARRQREPAPRPPHGRRRRRSQGVAQWLVHGRARLADERATSAPVVGAVAPAPAVAGERQRHVRSADRPDGPHARSSGVGSGRRAHLARAPRRAVPRPRRAAPPRRPRRPAPAALGAPAAGASAPLDLALGRARRGARALAPADDAHHALLPPRRVPRRAPRRRDVGARDRVRDGRRQGARARHRPRERRAGAAQGRQGP